MGAFMIAKSKIAWAINETTSMKRAARLLNISYNTFKKYAKMYELFQPASNAGVSRDSMGKPLELERILAGDNPNYSTTKLQQRLCREGYLAEECSNCAYDEYRPADMTKPLLLDYLDDDPTNKELANLRLLCYNCFYLLKMDRLGVDTPASVKSFQKAVYNVFGK
tara:strand:- start:478 stop:975 length:498 start_codon:yes stop_codon:yes gene_type:complete